MSLRHIVALIALSAAMVRAHAGTLDRIKYNYPGLTVDLGVGLWAWPVPTDADGDGDLDLLVSCPDKPANGVWLFENGSGNVKFPIFKAPRRVSGTVHYVTPSYVDGKLRVLTPGQEYPDFLGTGLGNPLKIPAPDTGQIHTQLPAGKPGIFKIRHNQWRYVDYNGDGAVDLTVGIEDWSDYGWDNAYNASGRWTNGPLHGLIYLLRNTGSTARPNYAAPVLVEARSKPVDTFGCPSPNFADFDGDGDLDLMCGEFLDGFSYFQNIGARTRPNFAPGRRLMHGIKPLTMDLQMIVPVAFDWDQDGDSDLIVGDEDGRVALVEHAGQVVDGLPQFHPPRYFQQEADGVKCGALATPCAIDWDGDGDIDIISGNTAGYIAYFENLSGPGVEQPRWAGPNQLAAGGKIIRIQAGPNGSIQGPAEAKWGYTTLSAADWDSDGLPDIILNSIWGKVLWYRNVGTRRIPTLAAAQPIDVQWNGGQPALAWGWLRPEGQGLLTQWRTTPVTVDWNHDGLMDLVMLDHEGYLAFFERRKRNGEFELLPGERVFCDEFGKALQLNSGRAGKSGRRKLCAADWDGDGKLDLLMNGVNATWLRQVAERDGKYLFKDMGSVSERNIEGHDTSPTTLDWNNDGIPDLLIGAEDGFFYYMRNPRTR
jgi:hypothetical protein